MCCGELSERWLPECPSGRLIVHALLEVIHQLLIERRQWLESCDELKPLSFEMHDFLKEIAVFVVCLIQHPLGLEAGFTQDQIGL